MNLKGIVFDLDGVLVFTDKFHYLAWKQMADKEGIYFDEKINNRLRGVSRMESLEIILERAKRKYTEEEKLALATYKNEIYRSYLMKMSESDVPTNVLLSLTALKIKGLKLAVGSSSKNAKLILNQTKLTPYFDAISDGTNISKSKPDPEVFLKAAKMLDINPNNLGVVEDSRSGIDAAKTGGFTSFGIGDAFSYEETDYPIMNLLDILILIG